jgi:acetyl esterase/lipase
MPLISRRFVLMGGSGAMAGLGTGACTPLEALNTLAKVDKGGGLVASGVQYGPHPRQAFDVYRPDRPGNAPVLVYFYGGNWNSGRRQDYAFIGKTFAARGFLTILADYRIMPEYTYPAFIEDGAVAVRVARARASEWGGASGPVYVAGHSAGAYIAVMLGASSRWGARQHIAAVVGIAGPYDFYPFTNPVTVATFGRAADPRSTQPVAVAEAGAPPMLLLQGAADTTVLPRNSGAMARRLRAQGNSVQEILYPGVGHIEIMTALTATFRKRAPTLNDTLRFLVATGARPI